MEARRDLLQEKSQRQKVGIKIAQNFKNFQIEAYVDTLQDYIRHLKRRNEILSTWVKKFCNIFQRTLLCFHPKKVAQQTYERTTILNDLREINLELDSLRKEKTEQKKICVPNVLQTGKDSVCPVCQSEYGQGNAALVCFNTCGHCLCFTW